MGATIQLFLHDGRGEVVIDAGTGRGPAVACAGPNIDESMIATYQQAFPGAEVLPTVTDRQFRTDMPAHEYPVRDVPPAELDHTMTLVGECGGLSSILGSPEKSGGYIVIDTEHGSLALVPDQAVAVLDMP
jgi:hypothetical protein